VGVGGGGEQLQGLDVYGLGEAEREYGSLNEYGRSGGQ